MKKDESACSQSLRFRRQRTILVLSAVLLLIVSLCVAKWLGPDRVPAASLQTRPVLVIDPGHGGIDGGAIARDGTKESDLNLSIALKLRDLSVFFGVETVLTRDDDLPRTDLISYSEHEDLVFRSEIANHIDRAILFSIHQNTFPTSQPHGVQVLYGAGEESRRLGELTHGKLIQSLQPDNRRVAAPAPSKLYLTSHVDCPVILIECGFLSNLSDLQLLCDSRYQTKFGAVLLSSYLHFTRTPNL